MKTYDEKTTARLCLGSDKRTVVTADDPKAAFLLAIHGPVTRADAHKIRGYKNGADFLEPINAADVPADEPAKAPPAPKAKAHPNHKPIGEGPDSIVDWGNKYKGQRVGDLEEKYLTSLTKGNSPDDRKALANVELDRRKALKTAPPAPLAYGPEDVVSLGIHQDVAVKDLPEDFLKSLADGVEEIHQAWTKAELQRRADEA